jgi:hypothetical protein
VVVSIPSRNIRLSEQRSDDPSTWRITGNKRAFAEEIVPTLSPERFENFRLIFNKIDAILSHLSSADGE